MATTSKFDFKPVHGRAQATFAKRHDRPFSGEDADKDVVRKYIDDLRAPR